MPGHQRFELVVAAVAAAILATEPVRAEPGAAFQAPGTKRMADMLKALAEEADAQRNPYLNTRRVELLRKAVESAANPGTEMSRRIDLARELIFAGHCEEGLQELETVRQRMAGVGQALPERAERFIRELEVIANLRLGELENCCARHTVDSCFVPIKGKGIHSIERGSRSAIELLLRSLNEDGDLLDRWLLNLACMTLGEYPEKVPPQWLIPPASFASDYDIGRFYDVAIPTGLDVVGLAGGAVMEDLDGDETLDILSSSWDLSDEVRYFRNNADGTFTERTEQAGLTGITGGLNMIHADYKNDGFADVLILRGAWLLDEGCHPNSLLRNNGDGTFEDVTEAAGVLSFHPTQAAAWGDYDNDGHVDLFIGNESRRTGGDHPCELYRNNGDGTFTESAAEVGLAYVGFVKGAVFGDYDNDRYPDLYLSVNGGQNVLFHNNGPSPGSNGAAAWSFTDVTESAGVGEPLYSFPTWFFDYDNDGWLDIIVFGYQLVSGRDVIAAMLGQPHGDALLPRLYHNDGNGTFSDVTEAVGLSTPILAMGANFGDLDNDGFLDFYAGTGEPDYRTVIPNLMFRNAGNGTFQDVTTSGGFGNVQKGHGIAFGDLDHDGDQDIYADLGGAFEGDVYQNLLFRNPGHGNHWITLRLRGVRTNRAAIGARIHVRVATEGGDRDIHLVAGTGGSFGSSSLQQEIGLGAATAIRSVEITWPVTGERQVVTGVSLDGIFEVTEGRPEAVRVEQRPFALPDPV